MRCRQLNRFTLSLEYVHTVSALPITTASVYQPPAPMCVQPPPQMYELTCRVPTPMSCCASAKPFTSPTAREKQRKKPW